MVFPTKQHHILALAFRAIPTSMQSVMPPPMEGLDNHATSSPAADAAPRRRSGRVVRTSDKLGPEATFNAKRKRLAELDDEDEENESLGDDERPSDEDDDDMAEEHAP